MLKGKIAEIFSSIQGEGIYVGIRQLFIRFYGCNLSACRFCDTKLDTYREYSLEELLKNVLRFKDDYHSISITGGEPLLQNDFLKEFLSVLKPLNKKIYLETNGTLPDALKESIDFIDIIAMDFKLPSSTGLGDYWQVHRVFLRKALAKEVFVKSVITDETEESDIEQMRNIIAEIDPSIPLTLQPVTPVGDVVPVDIKKLLTFRRICLSKLKTVKITPQFHKKIGVK